MYYSLSTRVEFFNQAFLKRSRVGKGECFTAVVCVTGVKDKWLVESCGGHGSAGDDEGFVFKDDSAKVVAGEVLLVKGFKKRVCSLAARVPKADLLVGDGCSNLAVVAVAFAVDAKEVLGCNAVLSGVAKA